MTWRSITRIVDDNTHVFEMYGADKSGQRREDDGDYLHAESDDNEWKADLWLARGLTKGSRPYLLGPEVPSERREIRNDSEHVKDKRVKTIVGAVLLLWLVLAFILGANDAFAGAPGALPLPILAGLLTPILVFLVAFWTVGPFRDFVMSIDLPVMAGIQAWRFGGLGFIALYAYGVLPGLFAWPPDSVTWRSVPLPPW